MKIRNGKIEHTAIMLKLDKDDLRDSNDIYNNLSTNYLI